MHSKQSKWIIGGLTAVLLVACGRTPEPAESKSEESATTTAEAVAPSQPKTYQVQARDFSFQGPSEVPSGWITVLFRNNGTQTHFLMLTLLPEGKTLDDYRNEVGPPFEKAWKELKQGADKAKVGQELGAALPEWYLKDTRYMGGPGLLAPGESEMVSLKLVPGNYVVECYVRSPEGEFHGNLGMLRKLTVTDVDSGQSEPTGDIHLTLSNDGIEAPDTLSAGEHTVAIHFKEQPAGGLGNDVHLARLAPDTDMAKLASWMDWMNLHGLQAPAPALFLGGAEEMAAGNTEYLHVNLEPGRYAWISEPVSTDGKLKVFRVD